jgi:signal transduction histidine kinase
VPAFSNDLFVLVGLDRDAEHAVVDRAVWKDALILGLIVLALIATAVASWETAGALTRHERTLTEAKATAERVAAGQQRIADTIGHDLRNSVQTLVSFLRNLRRNSTQPPDPTMLPYVARAIGDLRSSLDVLIRASRLEADALEPRSRSLQLSTFLKKVANDWQFFAETKGLALIVQAGSETVETDPDLLRTIVANLVSNSIKHTDSGTVTVSTGREADGRLGISVRDTGKGIPPEKAQIIFEAFSRLEPEKTEGLGLGLSIAKRSADLLGCEIVLDRGVESGCRFVVRLPRVSA